MVAPTRRRRHQQGEESRLRILAAAFEIASERGYDGTTLALVTKRAGLPASSVYWQFKSKDELLAEAIEHNYREWRSGRANWLEVPTGSDLDEQVELAMRHLAAGLIDQPQFQRLGLMLALERRPVEATARARFRQVRHETIMTLTGWWHQALPQAAIARNPQAPHELAQLMISLSDGLFVAAQTDDNLDTDRVIELLIIAMRAIVRSYLTDGTAGPAGKRAGTPVRRTAAKKAAAAKSAAPKRAIK
ncbi:MAG: TetR/AcrR family transcriptional regulator [Jatrophihabitantaceae bacterium]